MGRRSTAKLNKRGGKHDESWHDPRGGHIRIYWEVLDSPAWAALSASGMLVYIALMRDKRSHNNGDLSLPLSRAKHRGLRSSASLRRGLIELQAVGFIEVTRTGGHKKRGQREPNLYRFTEFVCYANERKHIEHQPVTGEWKNIKNKEMGQALIRKALPPSMRKPRKQM